MTLSDIRSRIWDGLGKPTDLDPSSDIQYNNGPLLTWVANAGQRQIAFWRDPIKQNRIMIRSLYSTLNYQITTKTDSVTSVNNSTAPYYIEVNALAQDDDRYNDWIIVINGESMYVVDYDGTNRRCYVEDSFSTTPVVGDVIALYKNFDFLLPSTHTWVAEHIELPGVSDRFVATGNFFEPLSLIDITNDIELTRAQDNARFSGYLKTYGTPTSWTVYANKIMYNYAIDEQIWLRLEYYRAPLDMSNATDEPEIPEIYHYAIVLWGIWHGYVRVGEASAAQLAWANLMNYIRATYGQNSVNKSRSGGRGVLMTR